MVNVLIVSSEPRLVDALRSNLGEEAVVRTAFDAEDAVNKLFAESYEVVFVDYEAIRGESPETFVTIDNVLIKERSHAALLLRKPSESATRLTQQLSSLNIVVDLSKGRRQFDDKVALLYAKARDAHETLGDDPSISTDRLARRELDLPAPNDGDLLDTSLPRLLYTLHQRKESGVLTLKYASHTLRFGVLNGEFATDARFGSKDDLLGAFAWSHGTYAFDASKVGGETSPIVPLIAEGCRHHTRQRNITEALSAIMRRYPVTTNLWEDRRPLLEDYHVLVRVMDACDGSTQWERLLSGLGDDVADGFRAAYFATQLDLVQTVEQPGLVGIAVNYSRSVREARQKVDQAEVEKTKAFQASSGSGRSELERELSLNLRLLRDGTPHEILGVWEGCGRKVVQDRFYVLVKEHHPDVYGGNTSGNVKSLAQEIFILIKDSYQKLLSIEKQQTVAPPAAATSRDDQPSEVAAPALRPRLETPRATASPIVTVAKPEKKAKPDVRAKLATLSGFQKKQKVRRRLASYAGRSEAEDDGPPSIPPSLDESSAISQEFVPEESPETGPASEVSVVDEVEDQRQAKLDHLLRRAQKVGHPDAPSPAKDFFNKGYHAFRENKKRDAFDAFARAYELEPTDSTYMTFYAHALYLTEPDKLDEAEQLLRAAIQSGNRQSVPDACLFLGYVLKTRGETREAVKMFKRAHALNPLSHEAERELRLAERRMEGSQKSDPASFIKGLFKK